MAGYGWKRLACKDMAGSGLIWLEMVRKGWNKLDMAGMAGNGWKWLKIAGNGLNG